MRRQFICAGASRRTGDGTMRRYLIWVGVCGIAFAGLPALAEQAEPGTGSRIPGRSSVASREYPASGQTGPSQDASKSKARALMRGTAECLVKRKPKLTQVFLSSPPDKAKGTFLADDISDCMERQSDIVGFDSATMQFSWDVLRGELAEAWIRLHPTAELPAAPVVAKSYEAGWMQTDRARMVVEEMGACLAATHPKLAVELVSQKPGSDAEALAVRNMVSVIGQCVGTGINLKIDSYGLRNAVALGLYHRAFDTEAMSQTGISH